MEKTWKQFRVWTIIFACCLIVLGAVMLIWPGASALAVCYVAGGIFIALGVYDLVRYFNLGLVGMFFRYDLALGICNILIGILLFCHPAGAMTFLPIAVGIYMIMDSVFCIQLSVELRRRGESWGLMLCSGIVGLLFAFLLLLDPFAGASMLMIFTGVSLVVSGIQAIYLTVCVSKAVKAEKEAGFFVNTTGRPME